MSLDLTDLAPVPLNPLRKSHSDSSGPATVDLYRQSTSFHVTAPASLTCGPGPRMPAVISSTTRLPSPRYGYVGTASFTLPAIADAVGDGSVSVDDVIEVSERTAVPYSSGELLMMGTTTRSAPASIRKAKSKSASVLSPPRVPRPMSSRKPPVPLSAASAAAASKSAEVERSYAWVVLRDVPKICIVVDRVPVWVRSSFRGFNKIPPGTHVFEIADHTGSLISLSGEIAVFKYADGAVVPESDEQVMLFRQLVSSRVLDNQFERYPEEARQNMEVVAADVRESPEPSGQLFKRSRYLPEDIRELGNVFHALVASRQQWAFKRYAELLRSNYASERVMSDHIPFFVDLARVLAKHVAAAPDLCTDEECRLWLGFITNDMQLLRSYDAVAAGKDLEKAMFNSMRQRQRISRVASSSLLVFVRVCCALAATDASGVLRDPGVAVPVGPCAAFGLAAEGAADPQLLLGRALCVGTLSSPCALLALDLSSPGDASDRSPVNVRVRAEIVGGVASVQLSRWSASVRVPLPEAATAGAQCYAALVGRRDARGVCPAPQKEVRLSNGTVMCGSQCPLGFYATSATSTAVMCSPCSTELCTICPSNACEDNGLMTKHKCLLCDSGYTTGNSDSACSPCQSDCVECTSSTNCTRCSTGMYSPGPGEACRSCPLFKSCDGGVLVDCHEGCASCIEAHICKQCLPGYYKGLFDRQCSKCQEGCLECTRGGDCQQCAMGYVLDPRGGGSCSKCAIGACATCTPDGSACTSCRNVTAVGATCRACPAYCTACDRRACTACSEPLRVGSECACVSPNAVDPATGVCSSPACLSKTLCATCANGVCTACADPLRKAPDCTCDAPDVVVAGGLCARTQCGNTLCSSCFQDGSCAACWDPRRVPPRCDCSPGYRALPDGNCTSAVACSIPRCLKCNSVTECGQCEQGYQGPQCTAVCANPNCRTCSTPTTCTSCNVGSMSNGCQPDGPMCAERPDRDSCAAIGCAWCNTSMLCMPLADAASQCPTCEASGFQGARCSASPACEWCALEAKCKSAGAPCVRDCAGVAADVVCERVPGCMWCPYRSSCVNASAYSATCRDDCAARASSFCASDAACRVCNATTAANTTTSLCALATSVCGCDAAANESSCAAPCTWCASSQTCGNSACRNCSAAVFASRCGVGDLAGCAWCPLSGTCVPGAQAQAPQCSCESAGQFACKGSCRWCQSKRLCISKSDLCPFCPTMTNASACNSYNGCTYDEGMGTCRDTSDTFSCGIVAALDLCAMHTVCAQCNGRCIGKLQSCAPVTTASSSKGRTTAIAAICGGAVGGSVALLLCLLAIVVIIVVLRRRRRRSGGPGDVELLSVVRAASLPGLVAVPPAEAEAALGIRVSRRVLDWNGAQVAVDRESSDSFHIDNVGRRRLVVAFVAEGLNNTDGRSFSLSVDQSEPLAIAAGYGGDIVVRVTPAACMTVLGVVAVVPEGGSKYVAVPVRVTTAPSARIDWGDIALGERIGEGGFGVVYRGAWRGLDVAVKEMRAGLSEMEQFVREMQHEVDIMMALRSPHVVMFYGYVSSREHKALVMELSPIGSITPLLAKPLDPKFKVKALQDCAEGMRLLHAHGILHRDLKPDNLLVFSMSPRESVCVKLSDFGTSRAVGDEEARSYTKGIGTFLYMAPEIINGRPYNTKADVWSFAVLYYHVWTQREPYSEFQSQFAIVSFITAGKRLPIPGDLPHSRLLSRCWAEEPEHRPSFEEITRALSQA
eukprot:m51a1_g1509 putative protein serine threonine (1741) ;mRNA; r:394100-401236